VQFDFPATSELREIGCLQTYLVRARAAARYAAVGA
jgi:hypothetical protein